MHDRTDMNVQQKKTIFKLSCFEAFEQKQKRLTFLPREAFNEINWRVLKKFRFAVSINTSERVVMNIVCESWR